MKSIQLTQEEILHIIKSLVFREAIYKDTLPEEEKLADDIFNKLLGK
jgi:hypothetical protein